MPAKSDRCVVLVSAFGPVSARCEDGLKELERRGYTVRRGRGFSAIDQGRNQMASAALQDGFEETMWIDSDIGFSADAVEKLRSHAMPICCSIYPQPPGRSVACHLLPGADKLVFGEKGGLIEIKYAAAGFLHVRRAAYEAIRDQLQLPLCNTRFGRGNWPFFQPLAVKDKDAGTHRYLTEDYAFSHRARLAGLKVMADTSIRLWRTGSYTYGWEDAGSAPDRFESFVLDVE